MNKPHHSRAKYVERLLNPHPGIDPLVKEVFREIAQQPDFTSRSMWEIGISHNIITTWLDGRSPRLTTLRLVADRLGLELTWRKKDAQVQ